MNKKGYIQDFAVFALILFVISIIIIVGAKLGGDFNEHYQNSGASDDAKQIVEDNISRYTTLWDYAFLTILVLFIIAIFAAFFVSSAHPAFFFVTALILGFMLIPLAILSNTYDTFISAGSVAGEAAGFSIMNWLLDKWPFIFGIVGLGGMAILFAKMRQ